MNISLIQLSVKSTSNYQVFMPCHLQKLHRWREELTLTLIAAPALLAEPNHSLGAVNLHHLTHLHCHRYCVPPFLSAKVQRLQSGINKIACHLRSVRHSFAMGATLKRQNVAFMTSNGGMGRVPRYLPGPLQLRQLPLKLFTFIIFNIFCSSKLLRPRLLFVWLQGSEVDTMSATLKNGKGRMEPENETFITCLIVLP